MQKYSLFFYEMKKNRAIHEMVSRIHQIVSVTPEILFYAAGLSDGHATGHADGHADGHAAGQTAGLQKQFFQLPDGATRYIDRIAFRGS